VGQRDLQASSTCACHTIDNVERAAHRPQRATRAQPMKAPSPSSHQDTPLPGASSFPLPLWPLLHQVKAAQSTLSGCHADQPVCVHVCCTPAMHKAAETASTQAYTPKPPKVANNQALCWIWCNQHQNPPRAANQTGIHPPSAPNSATSHVMPGIKARPSARSKRLESIRSIWVHWLPDDDPAARDDTQVQQNL
jgi:hypothetical protein